MDTVEKMLQNNQNNNINNNNNTSTTTKNKINTNISTTNTTNTANNLHDTTNIPYKKINKYEYEQESDIPITIANILVRKAERCYEDYFIQDAYRLARQVYI